MKNNPRFAADFMEKFSYDKNQPTFVSPECRIYQGVHKDYSTELLICEYACRDRKLEQLIQTTHPYFLPVLAWGTDPDQKSIIVVLDLNNSTPLSTEAPRRAYISDRYTEDEVLKILGMLLSALTFARKFGYFHSKLTMDKVYVKEKGEIMVWGWVQSLENEDATEQSTQDTTVASEIDREQEDSSNVKQLTEIIRKFGKFMNTKVPKSPEFNRMMELMTRQTSDLPNTFEVLLSSFIDFFPSQAASLGLSNTGCFECKRSAALLICICREPPVPLCLDCQDLHSLQNIDKSHQIMRCELREMLNSAENSEQFSKQIETFRTILKELSAAMGTLTQCMEKTEEQFEQYIQSIREEKEKKLKRLNNYLERASELLNILQKLAEQVIFSDSQDLLIRLEQVPRPYFAVEGDDIWSSKQREHLSTLEAELYPALYVYYTGYGLVRKRIDIEEEVKCSQISPEACIDEGTTMAYCYGSKIAICGGQQFPLQFLLIEANSGLIEVAARTLFPRLRAGVVAISPSVYVFGGRESGPRAEVVSLESTASLQIADMLETNALFNPCASSDGYIYLPGRNVSKYDPRTDTYKKLFTLSFPFHTSTAITMKNYLYIFTDEGLVTADLQRMGTIRKSNLHTVPFCSNPAPKLIAQQAYFCSTDQSVVLSFTFDNTAVSQHELSLASC
jgi:hypothetical protein